MRFLFWICLAALFCACEKEAIPKAEVITSQKSSETFNYSFFSGEGVVVDSTVKMTIRIEGEKFSGKGPVNNFFGKLKDGVAAEPVGMTMMAGPEPMMQMETLFFKLLKKGKFTGIGEDSLKIVKDEKVVLTYIKILD